MHRFHSFAPKQVFLILFFHEVFKCRHTYVSTSLKERLFRLGNGLLSLVSLASFLSLPSFPLILPLFPSLLLFLLFHFALLLPYLIFSLLNCYIRQQEL